MLKRSAFIRFLELFGRLLPGDRLKTFVYLNLIAKPRKIVRQALTTFYRMDQIYEVLGYAKKTYGGQFSILEFGTADGYAFTKMLYATRYLGMEDRVTCHAFDTFEGMPAPQDSRDEAIITGDGWTEGQFKGRLKLLEDYCQRNYSNYRIHKGLFEETINDELLESLKTELPLLIWIDCDYYSSAKTVFQRLKDHIPNGALVYFDDLQFNYESRFTGEARLVHEINRGDFGDGYELVLDRALSLDLNRCYRFIRSEPILQYPLLNPENHVGDLHLRTNDSPLP